MTKFYVPQDVIAHLGYTVGDKLEWDISGKGKVSVKIKRKKK
jgi:antitoxin component of MazEF toxin-antitoxin module